MFFLSFQKDFLILRLLNQRLIVAICLTCFDQHLTPFGYSDFRLKNRREMFLSYSIPVTKIIGKTSIWTIFCFWESPPNYTNWEFMFLMQKYHVQWRVQWNLLSNSHNLVLPEKIVKSKDFISLTQIFKLPVWAPNIVKTYIRVT